MAQDDMHVVIFKILAYLYDCMKRGVEPDRAEYSDMALGIPTAYWTQIIRELVEHGYVSGASVIKTTSGDHVNLAKPRVTLDGVQFLMDNRMMAKAANFVKDFGGLAASIATPFL